MSAPPAPSRPQARSSAFIDVALTPATVDRWLARNSIVDALRDALPQMSGAVLDVGCGQQPYRDEVRGSGQVTSYVGIDIAAGRHGAQDVSWDGRALPIRSGSVDVILLTEVLEHCPEPGVVLREACRALTSEGLVFITVPFLWPLHEVPHDHARLTPFALEALLAEAGFSDISVKALGGWDASLAQMIGLWVRRRPMSARRRAALSALAVPLVRRLVDRDRTPGSFKEGVMVTGLSATARKPRTDPAVTGPA